MMIKGQYATYAIFVQVACLQHMMKKIKKIFDNNISFFQLETAFH